MLQRLPDTFMEILDGHRPKNVKLRQAGRGLRKLWDVEMVLRYDHMYLCRGWEQFVHAYDLRHGYFLVFRYDSNAMLTVKVFNMTMCRMCYQDNDDASMLCLFFLSIWLCLTLIVKKTLLHLFRQLGQQKRLWLQQKQQRVWLQ